MATGEGPDNLNEKVVDSVPHTYFNGFSLTLSSADVSALLVHNGQPVHMLNMSFTTAQTLRRQLEKFLDSLERVSGNKIMDTSEVGKVVETLRAEDQERP